MKFCPLLALVGFAWLAGCASAPETHSIATGSLERAYELRGSRLAALEVQAQQLCPRGHEVLRQWESVHGADAGAPLIKRWWTQATNISGLGEPEQAQLQVRCKAQ